MLPSRSSRRQRLGLTLLLTLAASGCTLVTSFTEERVTLHVATETATCYGPFERQCLLVREDPADEYELFYDEIEGFTYGPGYRYVIVVAWRAIDNPPQDASARAYRLIRVFSGTPA